MLDYKELAKEINKALDVKDKDGQPIETTPEMEAYAKAIITITTATTSHLPGTVTGTTAAGAPLAGGEAANGLLVGLTPGPWLGEMMGGFPTANPGELAKEAAISTGYIIGAAKINFAAGNITGTCTSTPLAPGPLALGAGQKGTVDALDGSAWAKLAAPPTGDPNLGEKVYKAITAYIKKNAEVTYLPTSVVGVCPIAAGPLEAGTAIGGTIS